MSLVILMTASFLFGQSVSGQIANEGDWKFIHNVQQVKFYYQLTECNGNPFFLLKIVNENSIQVHGTWQIDINSPGENIRFVGVLTGAKVGIIQNGSCENPLPDLVHPYPGVIPTDITVSLEANILRH